MTLKRRSGGLVIGFLLVGLFAVRSSAGQTPAGDARLTLERIFNSREFASERFGPARWMKDGVSFTLLENSASHAEAREIVRYRADRDGREILVPASDLVPRGGAEPLNIENYEWSADGTKLLVFTNSVRVWRQNTRGDYWVLSLPDKSLRRLGADVEASRLMFAKFSPDGSRVAYVYENDIYTEDLKGGRVIRLTWDGSERFINGTSDWVYEEEFGVRDGFRWSPDGRKIAFWHFDTSRVRDFFMINNTDTLYPRLVPVKYPKAGGTNSACRIGVVDAHGSGVVWLEVPGDPRNNYIARMDWSADSKEVVVQHLNRLQNTNAVLAGDAASGAVRTIFTDRDAAWVDVVDDMTWIGNGSRFTWLSETDGWRHAYLVSRSGKATLLTPGPYDVLGIDAVDEKGGWVYYTASPDNPTQRYLFRSPLDGKGKVERLTPPDEPGIHSYQISPSCRWAFRTSSTFGAPPVIDLVRLPGHTTARVLAANTALKKTVETLDRSPVEFFRVDIGDGVLLDGWMIKPPDFDPGKKYPLLFHVYGEPAGQTVLDRWGGNNALWHLMLAQKGYVVASVDNRGTPSPRGRAWRKVIYRQIGILASEDQAAAARALLEERPYLDSGRVGIWGWSGGGSMTLNMMFRHPEIYKTGIAVAFVANQRLYDTIYQERYMGLPEDNEEGFKNGSPITFASRLEGNLLIVHGTGDDNVHYQNFELLVNELVANNKTFSMMSYPNRSHGIREGRNTTLHLYALFTRFLEENLPPGPKSR